MRYACIARHTGEFAVRLMCRVVMVTPSGFYAWRKRLPSMRAIADERLMLNVRISHNRSGQTYGTPRVHRDLRAQGIRIGKKRVARLMKTGGLAARRPSGARAPRIPLTLILSRPISSSGSSTLTACAS